MPWDKTKTDPVKWAAEMKDAPREAVNIFAFELFKRVVIKTPVDTGAARQNWLVTLNSETDEFDTSKKKGGRVLIDGKRVIKGAKGDEKIIIQNNLPYIRMLEYGGYGKAKGQGAALKGKKTYINFGKLEREADGRPPVKKRKEEKKSKVTADGFSTQAPQGMVGLTLSKASQLWDRAVKAAKGLNK